MFRYIDQNGVEHEATTLTQLAEWIEQGRIGDDTLVRMADEDAWKKAKEHVQFSNLKLIGERSAKTAAALRAPTTTAAHSDATNSVAFGLVKKVGRFFLKALLWLMLLWTLALAKVVGIFGLIVAGVGTLIYFVAKLIVLDEKKSLVYAATIMFTQALWFCSAPVAFIAMGNPDLDPKLILSGVAGAVYICGIIAFLARPSRRKAFILLVFVAGMLVVYVAATPFSQLDNSAQPAAALAITLYIYVLLLLPLSYSEYEAGASRANLDSRARVDQLYREEAS